LLSFFLSREKRAAVATDEDDDEGRREEGTSVVTGHNRHLIFGWERLHMVLTLKFII
jgi:hypothetical protein